jgi:hypothetical protein
MATAPKIVDVDKEASASIEIIGHSGLSRFGGEVSQELHAKLRGKQATRIYRQMRDNDPVIGGILYAIEALIKQAEWRIEPAGEKQEHADAAEFVDGALFTDMDMTFEDLTAEVLSMLPFGWSFFELVFKRRLGDTEDPTTKSAFDDGRIGWRKIAIRSQDSLDRWEFDENGEIAGMWQLAVTQAAPVLIPMQKALLFRTTTHLGNPEGRSMLRNSYRPWYFKTRLEEIEAIGMERDLAGYPVMEVPPTLLRPDASAADQALRNAIETLVQQVRRDEREGMVIPSELDKDGKPTGYKFRLLSTGGRRSIDVGQSIVRYEQRIAVSVLAEFLFLGLDKVGSFSLAQTKTSLFSTALNAIMDSIASVFNRFGIPQLMGLNGFDREVWPTLVHGEVIAPPLEEFGKMVSDLVGAGVIIPDPALERKVRELSGLPEREEAELLEPRPELPKPEDSDDLGGE